jgi:capsular polysaccharide biosynthesis protein
MSELYSTEYKEINISYLLKIITRSRLMILSITLFSTLLSGLWAYSVDPLYKSEALIEIGTFHSINKDGEIEMGYLDTAVALTRELSYLFLDKTVDDASIVEISSHNRINKYIAVVSEGKSQNKSKEAINRLYKYIKTKHKEILLRTERRLELDLSNTINRLDSITKKQLKFLSEDDSNKDKDYDSLLNTFKLMATLNDDIGVDYIGQQILDKKRLELLLTNEYQKNTTLVGEINSSNSPFKPRKGIIIFFGFFLGFFSSLSLVFIKAVLKEKD